MTEKLLPVEIVRPSSGVWADLVTSVLTFLARAFTVMLVLGALFPYLHVGYGKAVLVVLLASSLFPENYNLWTRARRRK